MNDDPGSSQMGITPYICAKDASRAIQFYIEAFGAVEVMRLVEPSGRIGHAEIRIGNAILMLSDEYPEIGVMSPQTLNGSPVTLHLMTKDADETINRASAAGATVERPPEDQFYGHRSGTIRDPFGHRWMIGAVKEELTAEEVERRFAALCGGQS